MTPERIAQIQQAFVSEFARAERGEHPAGFPTLPEIPAARYFDPGFYELEQRRLWPKSWLLAGHLDELPEAGSYKAWNRAGWPVLMVRGKDGRIRAFFDSCQHRGGSLLKAASGCVKVLTCKFHAWTYDLQGRLLFVPDEHEFPKLDKSRHSLAPLRCELWGKLIFVNRDLSAPPLLEFLGTAAEQMAHFDFDRRRIHSIIPYDLPCNWKVVMDAFQESYHINGTHPQTVAPFLDSRGAVIEMWRNGHSQLIVPWRRGDRAAQDFILDAGSHSADPRHEITRAGNTSFTIYPNIIGTAAEYQFPILLFWPEGPNRTHVDILITEPEGRADLDPAQANAIVEQFKAVMAEDMGNVSAIQRSVECGALKSLRLGYTERRIYQFHEQLDRDLGEAVPPALRVPDLLSAFIENTP